jgi:hypothetical protein
VAAGLTPAALWRDHRLFTVLVVLAAGVRVLATLAFRPALFIPDSFTTAFTWSWSSCARLGTPSCCARSGRSTACCW